LQYKGKILRIIEETPRVRLIQIERPTDFSFESGQFVMLSIDGFSKDNIPVKRSYSISSSPNEKQHIEVCITKQDNGLFSTKLHQVSEGDIINVNGPYGVFKLKKNVGKNTTFVAGGSGIAPIISMLRGIFSEGNQPLGLRLFFGFRSPVDFIYKDEILRFEKEGKLTLHLTIDTPIENWTGDVGFVSQIIPKYSNFEKSDVYLCGPPMMVNATIRSLKESGFDELKIHREQW
jgi:NAD(P)H-flavin reductase